LQEAASSGNRAAADALMNTIYAELRGLANHLLNHERVGHTLQPTALVHEAYARLIDQTRIEWRDRTHFFAAAAETARRVLVDHARARMARKRGSGAKPVTLDGTCLGLSAVDEGLGVLELHDLLESLAAEDQRAARIVEMRLFGAMSVEEIAAFLGISARTVDRDWKFARAWLYEALKTR